MCTERPGGAYLLCQRTVLGQPLRHHRVHMGQQLLLLLLEVG